MSDFEKLKRRLKETPYLVINAATGEALLTSAHEVLPILGERTLFVMDLENAAFNFGELTDQTEFCLHDLAKVAGVEYHAVYAWLKQQVLTPSIARPRGAGRGRGPVFSFADAFAAGVIGTLRRQGIGLEVMRQIGPLLNGVSAKSLTL